MLFISLDYTHRLRHKLHIVHIEKLKSGTKLPKSTVPSGRHDVAGTPSSIVGVGAWSNVSNDIPTMIIVCMVSGHV